MALNAPKLILIYSYRNIAAVEEEQIPVFSICETDTIYFTKICQTIFLLNLNQNKVKCFKIAK